MELRVLHYFLAVAREQNISAAANSLHLTQPTLSRQLKDLEDELGKQLFYRNSRKITLTEEGMILKKRAEEILSLVHKTENEIASSEDDLTGDIMIGCGESYGMHAVLRIAKKLQDIYPNIHFHIISDDQEDVLDKLDRGLIDFGVVFGKVDVNKFNYKTLSHSDTFGVLMKKDDPLAQKETISIDDLHNKPIITSRQSITSGTIYDLFGKSEDKINIVGSYNLLYNGSIMVEEGMGYAIGLDHIINTSGNSNLIFRPIDQQLDMKMTIIWKKYQVFAKATQKFLDLLTEE